MCGIAGFYGNYDAGLLSAMSEAVQHRGPDGDGEVLLQNKDGNVGLAHRRLSIIDLSPAGKQPMTIRCPVCGGNSGTTDKDRLWISYNGELYNFPELKAELVAAGHQFHSKTDTEVILHLYAVEGMKAFSRLNGIFALALYDGRLQGQRDGIKKGDLILARDGLGVKPLYYAETPSGVLYASEIKALIEAADLNPELDPQALRMYLSYLYAPAPSTAIRNVKKIHPGEWLLVREKKIVQRQFFYDVPYLGEENPASEAELTEKLRIELEAAVKRQLISDVPVGAFLSGGMDSSSVVALMQRAQGNQSFRCFTIGDGENSKEGAALNDLYYAKLMAKELKLDLSVVEVRPANFDLLEKVLYHLDEPQADPAAINAYLICKQAREEGIKVLMSGAGGDDIFSGYPRHFAVHTESLWKWIPPALKQVLAQNVRRQVEKAGGTAFIRHTGIRKISKVLAHLDWEQDARLCSYFLNSSAESINPLLGEGFHEESRKFDLLSQLRHSLERIPQEKDILNRMLYLETKHFLGDHNLNYVDKMSMACGVEVRVPIIDLQVVNFVAGLPSRLKRHGFENKYLFKKAVSPFLPKPILTRKKQGFGLPIRTWLQRDLYDVVQETLSAKSLKNRGLFNPVAVEKLIKLDRSAQIDATFAILSMMCIELWCRRFIDKTQSTSQVNRRLIFS